MSLCEGYSSYFSPACYIETYAAAFAGGLAKGPIHQIGKQLSETLADSVQKLNFSQFVNQETFDGAGTKLGDFLAKEGNGFLKQIGGDNFGDGAGTKLGNFLAKEGNGFLTQAVGDDPGGKIGKTIREQGDNFFKGLDIDPEKAASNLGNKAQNTNKAFLDGLNTKKIFEDLGKAFDDGLDGLDLSGRVGNVGNELKTGINDFTREIGDGLQDAFRNLITGVRDEFIFRQLPYFLGAGVLTTCISMGIPLTLGYLYYKAKHSIGRPKLATETQEITLANAIISPLGKVLSKLKSKPIKPIYHPDLERRISDITKAFQNIRKNGGYFPNVVFYGEGGTGKTMISNEIAKASGMSYIKISGGDLAQYIKRGEHVTELNKIFNKMEARWRPWAPWRSIRPWLLFVDEAESLCKDRNKITSAELLELQNAFLSRSGTQTKDFGIMLATNRIQDLDGAIKSRLDYKVYIGPPAKEQRAEILNAYLPQFFSKKERKEIFTSERVAQIAEDTEGFTGRSLFKLLNAISNKKAATEKNVLVLEDVLQTVKDFVKQEKDVTDHTSEQQLPPAPAPVIIKRAKQTLPTPKQPPLSQGEAA